MGMPRPHMTSVNATSDSLPLKGCTEPSSPSLLTARSDIDDVTRDFQQLLQGPSRDDLISVVKSTSVNDDGSLSSPRNSSGIGGVSGGGLPARMAVLGETTAAAANPNNPYGNLFGWGNTGGGVNSRIGSGQADPSTTAGAVEAALPMVAVPSNSSSSSGGGGGGSQSPGVSLAFSPEFMSGDGPRVDLREMLELKRQNELLASELALARGANATMLLQQAAGQGL